MQELRAPRRATSPMFGVDTRLLGKPQQSSRKPQHLRTSRNLAQGQFCACAAVVRRDACLVITVRKAHAAIDYDTILLLCSAALRRKGDLGVECTEVFCSVRKCSILSRGKRNVFFSRVEA